MDYSFLSTLKIFEGISPEELKHLLPCLNWHVKKFKKGDFIFHAGEVINEIGVILSGNVIIEAYDLMGNKNVFGGSSKGEVVAVSYSFTPNEPLIVNVIAGSDVEMLFIDINKSIYVCSASCKFHSRLVSNLLNIIANCNLSLSRRSLHTSHKSIRTKLISYLSYQVIKNSSNEFDIPFDREHLAGYLNVERSALSNELGKMKREGLIDFKKNHFVINQEAFEASM